MSDRDKILQKTNGGLDVFTHYMGEDCKKKVFSNPFRSDSNPSCRLYYHDDKMGGEGRYILKDFGDSSWKGDCFWLVSQLTNLSLQDDFSEILHLIDKELDLYILTDAPVGYHPVKEKVKPSSVQGGSKIVKFYPYYRNYNRYELDYWAAYGITLDILRRFNVKCLSKCYFEREDGSAFTIYGNKDIPMFGYTFNVGTGIKVYRPGAKIGRFMYAGNLPRPYIFGLEQIGMNIPSLLNIFRSDTEFDMKVLFITGGEKDVMSLAAHGFNAISLNSETAKVSEDLITRLVSVYRPIVFLYDSDETGKKESVQRVKECLDFEGIKKMIDMEERLPEWVRRENLVMTVTLPLAGTKQEKDVSDFFKSGHSAAELRDLVRNSIINK